MTQDEFNRLTIGDAVTWRDTLRGTVKMRSVTWVLIEWKPELVEVLNVRTCTLAEFGAVPREPVVRKPLPRRRTFDAKTRQPVRHWQDTD